MKVISILYLFFITFLLTSCTSAKAVEVESMYKNDEVGIQFNKEEVIEILSNYMDKVENVSNSIFQFKPSVGEISEVKEQYYPVDLEGDFGIEEYHGNSDFIYWINLEFSKVVHDITGIDSFYSGEFVAVGNDGAELKVIVYQDELKVIKQHIQVATKEREISVRLEVLHIQDMDDLMIKQYTEFVKYDGNIIDISKLDYHEIYENHHAINVSLMGDVSLEYEYLDLTSNDILEYVRTPNGDYNSEYIYLYDYSKEKFYVAGYKNDNLATKSIGFMYGNRGYFSFVVYDVVDGVAYITWDMANVDGWDHITLRGESDYSFYYGDAVVNDEQEFFQRDEIIISLGKPTPMITIAVRRGLDAVDDELLNLRFYGLSFNEELSLIALNNELDEFLLFSEQDIFLKEVVVNAEFSNATLISVMREEVIGKQ